MVSTALSIGDANCPYGGTKLAAGSTLTYACNGAPGAPAQHFSAEGDVPGMGSLTLVHNLGTPAVTATAWAQDTSGTWKVLGVAAEGVTVSTQTIGDALVAYWPFEELSPPYLDASGQGRSLTLAAGTGVRLVPGQVKNALQFDGATALVTPLTGIDPAVDLTFGAWVFLNPTGYVNQTWIIAAPNTLASAAPGFALFVNGDNSFQCQGGIKSAQKGFQGWHHVVCAIEPDTLLQHLYVDGVEATIPSNVDQPLARLMYVGGFPQPWKASRFFKGAVDEAFLSNRPVSAIEIQTLMGAPSDLLRRSSVKDFRVEQPDVNTVVLYNDNRQLLHLRLEVGH